MHILLRLSIRNNSIQSTLQALMIKYISQIRHPRTELLTIQIISLQSIKIESLSHHKVLSFQYSNSSLGQLSSLFSISPSIYSEFLIEELHVEFELGIFLFLSFQVVSDVFPASE